MLTENLALLFERDIQKVKAEISSYTDESKLWATTAQLSNSGGNLCLHLLGNLQHYIGHVLGNSGYTRNRPLEFSQKNVPVAKMVSELEHTAAIVIRTIRSVSDETLAKDFPEKVYEHAMSTEHFLLHLLAHLNYHLGQINYHRRMLDAYQPEAGG
jgi:uncharacterized damage-inducible protein DinB